MTSSNLVLAIETSQRQASVALRGRSGRILEEPLSPRKRHDDDLLPAIDRMFTRAGLASKDLRGPPCGPPCGAVCVSIGPGGFTGLRIAIATAKMFSEALGARLVAVPSALVAAEGSNQDGGTMLIALACKNDSFWATRVRWIDGRETAGVGGGRWRVVGEPGIERADSFDVADVCAVIADEFFPDAAKARVIAAGVPILPLALSARSVLMIGEGMLARGETVDPLHMLPLYPREPEAVTLWENRGLKA